jgi:ribosomal protein S15P/S13E
MEDKLVTIASFADYIEAEMAQQLLADYGIKAIATGQNASNVYPIPAVEGPELQVLQSQAEQARQILESHKKDNLSEDNNNADLMEQEQ